ncbi:hypothetical protein INT80_05180 [Gallibacterium anatis]|uniref:Uncharacterized protein n=1 Tax=Gallibacterium anatis TaxID=750 RepID=A0A930UTL7_9PAST|nr:hypothetical protein [Gallibacterium anatis]
MVLFYIVIDFRQHRQQQTPDSLVPYISALKGRVLQHCLIKTVYYQTTLPSTKLQD